MKPTPVYDEYWKFAHKRHAMYLDRLENPYGPWTDDPILSRHRFTNSYRVLDRVSQYLVRNIQYGAGHSKAPMEVFFRTILFKVFNKIETWEYLERKLDGLSWQSFDIKVIDNALSDLMSRGTRIYSAAYIMPAPKFGAERKHTNHLRLIERMMLDGLPARIAHASTLESAYEMIRAYPGMGPFLAFQYAIDLGYSQITQYDEAGFVVAGPGAHDGVSKCFEDTGRRTSEEVIMDMVERQDREFARLDLPFEGLFGRKLQPIDCQNLFCEISKYSRVSHPEIKGLSGRTRIKQQFTPRPTPVESPMLPPKWGVNVPEFDVRLTDYWEGATQKSLPL
jgi:hypothetical protein